MDWPELMRDEVVWIEAEAMREIDRLMIDEVGITLLQMMENAGRSLAALIRGEFSPASVLVLAGSGGNGGGGLVAARHLVNTGVDVRVALTSEPARFSDAAAHQLTIVEHMGVAVAQADSALAIGDAEVVVDAMVGYSLTGALTGRAAVVADELSRNESVAVASLDVPSGLSPDGAVAGSLVKADVTMTLCLPKVGLRQRDAVGRLFLADISVPALVVNAVTGGPAAPFERGQILAIS